MADILHRIGINSPAETVYKALSEQTGLAGWWTRNAEAFPRVGAINRFQFDDRGFSKMKVVELVPAQRVKWQCVDGAREWIGTELTFDLQRKEEVTVVLFAQRGWKEQVEFMHYCNTKWAVYLLSLKSLCETGQGKPFPDDMDIG